MGNLSIQSMKVQFNEGAAMTKLALSDENKNRLYQLCGTNSAARQAVTAVINAMEVTRIQHYELGVAHVGNLAGELFCLQGLLGGFFAALLPKLSGCLPLNMRLRARLGASPY